MTSKYVKLPQPIDYLVCILQLTPGRVLIRPMHMLTVMHPKVKAEKGNPVRRKGYRGLLSRTHKPALQTGGTPWISELQEPESPILQGDDFTCISPSVLHFSSLPPIIVFSSFGIPDRKS